MAMSANLPSSAASLTKDADYRLPLALMVALYFGMGFITAMNDVLVPHFKDLFHLSNFLALLVQIAFFGACFVMSVPSGWMVGRLGSKAGIVVALVTMGGGLLLFVPASITILYPFFLLALFVVGSGLALLQVAVNPYVGALGTPDTAASRLNLVGGFHSLATTLAPRFGASFLFLAAGASTAEMAHSVRAPYVGLAGCAFAMAVCILFVPLPDIIERRKPQACGRSAWSFRHLRYGAAAIFVYVGAEVAIGSLMITYLGQPSMGSHAHYDAARYVSFYWGGAMLGRFGGFALLRRTAGERVLLVVAAAATLLITAVLLTAGPVAMWALVACGLCNSVMWPCIFPLAIRNLGSLTSQGSGILITMVAGGAVIPAFQGLLADRFGYRWSFLAVLFSYGYLMFFALIGHRVRPTDRMAEEAF